MTSKSAALTRIQRLVDEIPGLIGVNSESPEFIRWRRLTRIAVSNTFGDDSRHVREVDQIYYAPISFFSDGSSSSEFARACQGGLSEAKAILESMVEEIEEYWTDDASRQSEAETGEIPQQNVSNRVFVVHGRDEGTKNTVARYLEKLDLEYVILQEQPNEGRTIIEKFEDYADVGFAVVLCTPDDVGSLVREQDNPRPRPRQNVVLEWGFFLGRLGRNRVCALLKDDVEIPSDYAGVVYIRLNESGGWQMELGREMRRAGLPADLNRLV